MTITTVSGITFTHGEPARPFSLSRVRVSTKRQRPLTEAASADDAEARRLVVTAMRLVIEAMSGRRPLNQLRGCVEVTPAWLAEWRWRIDWRNVRLSSIHTTAPSPNSIEANLRLDSRGRSTAATMRFVRRRGGWACTHFGLISPSGVQ